MHSNKPQHRPGSPAAVAHALLPTPPRGRRCPRGNRGLRSLLKFCWLPRDINSSLAAAGSSELGAGAGPAPGTDTSALVGRTERASCPLSTLQLPPRLLPAASLQAVQVRGAGEARVWQRGCQGQARRDMGCRSVGSGHWLKPGYAPYLGSSAAHLLRAPWGWASRSSLDRENSLSSPVVTFSAPKKTRGWLLQGPLVKMGGLYSSPGPTTGQSCGLRRHSSRQSLRAI